jgi:uncharacterized protein with GYD domain
MTWFLVRFQFNSASVKAMIDNPHDRMGPAKTLVESFGGKLHHYFFAFGDYDGVGIAEFPDNKSAAAFSLKAASTGAFSKFDTMVLMPSAEAEAAMKQARDTKSAYRPPNA